MIMSPGPTSPFFAIAPTPYGGRGVFATQHIPKDTLILTCESPYASVIYRKFRKEVCAWCFSWSLEVARKGSWSISVPLEPQEVSEGRKMSGTPKTNGSNAGVCFCGESCRDAWVYAGEGVQGGDDSIHAGVRGVVNSVLERCLMTMEKDKGKKFGTLSVRSGVALGWAEFLQSLEDLDSTTDISLAFMDNAWEQAERLSSVSSSSKPIHKGVTSSNNKNNKKSASSKSVPVSPTMLTEIELDTARFVLAGLLKKCIGENTKPGTNTSSLDRLPLTHPSGEWKDVLDLQDNTLAHIQAKPYMLASQIRVWAFIKFVVHSTLRESARLSDRTRELVYLLKKSVDTPEETRTLLGREHGNVFGIWDMAPEGADSEMLGWGLYSFGSYFNHDCSPTLRKKHKGRRIEYYALKDIDAGEELCISYVETDQVVEKRKYALKEWFFDCGCRKCMTELPLGSSLPV